MDAARDRGIQEFTHSCTSANTHATILAEIKACPHTHAHTRTSLCTQKNMHVHQKVHLNAFQISPFHRTACHGQRQRKRQSGCLRGLESAIKVGLRHNQGTKIPQLTRMLLASQERHQQPGCPLTVQAGEAQAAHCSVVRCTKVVGGGGRWGMKRMDRRVDVKVRYRDKETEL